LPDTPLVSQSVEFTPDSDEGLPFQGLTQNPPPQNSAINLGGLLEFGQELPKFRDRDGMGLGPLPSSAPSAALSGLPAHVAALIPSLMALKARILEELEANPLRLKALNQSRREALAQHLDRMAGLAPAPSSLNGNLDPAGGLRRWIEGPRSPSQNL